MSLQSACSLRLSASYLRAMIGEMELAGELGSLLKIDERLSQ